jgi:nicotinamidase-related amidase
MSPTSSRCKRSEKGLLTPNNCMVAIIDLQPQRLFGGANFDRQMIINNNVELAKTTKVFEVPVVLSTMETKSFSGNLWTQIQVSSRTKRPLNVLP